MSYQDRQSKRALERSMADVLRRTRCPECGRPLLWHRRKGEELPGPCQLTQEEIMHRVHGVVHEADADDPDVIDVSPKEAE